jgi:hypothetical protein
MARRLLTVCLAVCALVALAFAAPAGAAVKLSPGGLPERHPDGALFVPSATTPPGLRALAAKTAKKKKSKKLPAIPVIKSVSPMLAGIGDTLTIRGRNFLKGANKNTVIFLAKGSRAVFVKAGTGKKTLLRVKLPVKLKAYMTKKDGVEQPTVFQIRVLSRRLSKAFTKRSKSPSIGPVGLKTPLGTTTPAAPACDPSTLAPNGDADGDLLSNSHELTIHTDPCLADTDLDGVADGYEYRSALDLNSLALPYPGKRPYANPLDPSDGNTDYDGDSLTLREEYALWVTRGGNTLDLNYSDGKQCTKPEPAPAAPPYQDPARMWLDWYDGNGTLCDDEKDADGDGLSNYAEAHGPLSGQSWWDEAYPNETSYAAFVSYAGLDYLDPDTDGDGVPDGADDIDQDGRTNAQEWSRIQAGGMQDPQPKKGRVNPFNPCLPYTTDPSSTDPGDSPSPTCQRFHPAQGGPAPFDGSPSDPYDVVQ